MGDCYEIIHGDRCVGTMEVKPQGLYVGFSCRCDIRVPGFARVKARWQDRELDLGVLIPAGQRFSLDTKVAAKKCGTGIPEFRIDTGEEKTGTFVPIYPEEPFAYIARLKDAFFERRYGQPGIVLRDTQLPRDTAFTD